MRTERTLLKVFHRATLPEIVARNASAMFGITESFAHPPPGGQGTPDDLPFGFPGADALPGPPALPAIRDIRKVNLSMPKVGKRSSEFRPWVKVSNHKYMVSLCQSWMMAQILTFQHSQAR